MSWGGHAKMAWSANHKSNGVDLEVFRDLFVHRDDVYALQRETGSYYPVSEPVTASRLAAHLRGDFTLGVYQLRQDNTVKWVCWDLDTEDSAARAHLVNCVELLVFNLGGEDAGSDWGHFKKCLLLEDSNGQGRSHVWLFFDTPLPAVQVRRWLMHDFTPLWHNRDGEGDSPALHWPLEVFPKQDRLEEGGYGNLVRLPLGVNRKNGKKSRFIAGQGWASSVDSVRKLDSTMVPSYEGRASAPSWAPPSGRVIGDNAMARLQRGEVPRGERNNTFARAAWSARKDGWPEDLVLEQLRRLNDGLPEPMEDLRLERTVHGTYKKTIDIEPNERTPHRSAKEQPSDFLKRG